MSYKVDALQLLLRILPYRLVYAICRYKVQVCEVPRAAFHAFSGSETRAMSAVIEALAPVQVLYE